jgi:hypothetical protein
MKRATLVLVALALMFGGVGQLKAEFIITVSQVGANVEANGTGSINLAALTLFVGIPQTSGALVNPTNPTVAVGPATQTVGDLYEVNNLSGPTNFGTGSGNELATTGSGDEVALNDSIGPVIFVPHLYVSGTTLTSQSIWDNTTISALGMTPGTYTWTWGSVAAGTADSLELDILAPSTSTVPEPSTVTLLGIGAACSLGYGWRRRRQIA